MAPTSKYPSKGNKLNTQPVNGVEVENRGNPTLAKQSLAILIAMNEHRKSFSLKYGIAPGGYDMLLHVAGKWIYDNESSNVYRLMKWCGHSRPSVHDLAKRLYGKGLLEIAGYGNSRSPFYIPSKLGVSEFEDIATVNVA